MQVTLEQEELKPLLKDVVIELFFEKKEQFRDLFSEIVEDISMIEAIKEGMKSENIDKDELLKALDED